MTTEQIADPASRSAGPTATGRGVEVDRFDLSMWLKTNWAPILLAVLAVLMVLAVGYGVTAESNDALGRVCNVAAVPLLSIAIGYLISQLFHGLAEKENLRRDVQAATYTTLHLGHTVQYVDDRLEFAAGHLLAGDAYEALLYVVSAKTATENAYGLAQQSARQFELISAAGATTARDIFTVDNREARPKMKLGDNPKTVVNTRVSVETEDE